MFNLEQYHPIFLRNVKFYEKNSLIFSTLLEIITGWLKKDF